MKRILLAIMVVTGLLPAAQNPEVPQNPFPELAGPFRVGACDYFWVDAKREESLTTDPQDKRHLMVRVWYPADHDAAAPRHPYIVNPDEFGHSRERIAYLFRVLTRSVWEASVSDRKDAYPVLLFSHGAGMTRFSSTAITEALAAEGYVVFSIDHTFFNNIRVFPDGYEAVRDVWPEESASKDFIEYAADHCAADTAFVLDKIEELNRIEGGRFHKRLDLGRIGIFGWSLGGMNAAQVCADDGRVKAGINYDGTMSGRVVRTGVGKPFLLIRADREFIGHEVSFIQKSRGDVYVMTIFKSEHSNFSDLVLLQPRGEDRIDPGFCHEIIIAFTKSFFDKYLLGQDSGLLDRIPARYVSALSLMKKSNPASGASDSVDLHPDNPLGSQFFLSL